MISARAQLGLDNPALCNYQDSLYDQDPYHPTSNPSGYIKLSSADNMLSGDLVEKKFQSIDWQKFDTKKDILNYPKIGGEDSTMKSLASFINQHCRPGLSPIEAEKLVLVPGVTTGSDVLSHVLFEPGDIALVPGPNYYRFLNDLGDRGQVQLAIVPTLFNENRSELRVEEFERVYSKALVGNTSGKVRAVVIVNPQNPEGNYYTLEELRPVIKWALGYSLFVILDEIYDLTVYDPILGHGFQTAIQLFESTEERERLVWMWGLSKNFSVPGLRASVIYSENEKVRAAAKRFLMFHHPNMLTQFVAKEILEDTEWINGVFLPENLRRLKERRDFVISALEKIPGVKVIKPRAGFFILANFSKHLDEPTFEAERRLHKRLFTAKVILSAGETMFTSEPGWFRLVFTSMDMDTLQEGLKRLASVLNV